MRACAPACGVVDRRAARSSAEAAAREPPAPVALPLPSAQLVVDPSVPFPCVCCRRCNGKEGRILGWRFHRGFRAGIFSRRRKALGPPASCVLGSGTVHWVWYNKASNPGIGKRWVCVGFLTASFPPPLFFYYFRRDSKCRLLPITWF